MTNDEIELGERAVRRETILPVDRPTAWRALKDADGLSSWLADEVELEVREGAEGKLRWRGGEERLVTVEELSERRRLVLTWCEPGGEPSIVELTLDDVPGGTRLVAVEMPLAILRAAAAVFEQRIGRTKGPQMLAALR
jgi:uncharacterized protein YndB with AHSA1/START domain